MQERLNDIGKHTADEEDQPEALVLTPVAMHLEDNGQWMDNQDKLRSPAPVSSGFSPEVPVLFQVQTASRLFFRH